MSQPETSSQTPALAALLYIAQKLGNPGFHKACKLLYLADKLHLSEYGRFITDDNYKAYKFGPLPTEVYGKLTQERRQMTQDSGFRVEMNGNEPQIYAVSEPDMDQLSFSDLEALDKTISDYGDKSFSYLTAITHDSAWQAGRARSGSEMTLDEIVDTLTDNKALKDYLKGTHL